MEQCKFPDSFSHGQFVKYINQAEISALVSSLAHRITENYQGKDLILVGVLKGSLTFLADLVREVSGVNLYIDFIEVSSVNKRGNNTPGTIRFNRDIGTNINGKHVLVVEEIVDNGRALEFIQKRLMLSGPLSVKTMTLFDKPYKRKTDIVPDFVGKKIDDCFIIGYGLDLEEYGRNFCDVHFLKYPN